MATTELMTEQQQQQQAPPSPCTPQSSVTGMGTASESIEALTREVEQLKAKLEEERSKLTDVDGRYIAGHG